MFSDTTDLINSLQAENAQLKDVIEQQKTESGTEKRIREILKKGYDITLCGQSDVLQGGVLRVILSQKVSALTEQEKAERRSPKIAIVDVLPLDTLDNVLDLLLKDA